MRERATAEAFKPGPIRNTPKIPAIPAEPPDVRWTRRKRIGVAAAILLSAVIAFSMPTVRQTVVPQQSRSPQPPPTELHFPNGTQITPGTVMWFTPSEVMAPDQVALAPWPVYEPQTWLGLRCHNNRRQGVGAGHDIVVTLWCGSSPTAMQPTPLRCPIIGADKPYQTCRVSDEVAFAGTDWAKLEIHVGEQVIEPAVGFSCTALIVRAGTPS